jgi:hypothetical protein
MVRTTEVSLIREIYNRHCLSLAIDECDPATLRVLVVQESEGAALVRFSNPSGKAPNVSVIQDFLNRVLELSIQEALQDSQK